MMLRAISRSIRLKLLMVVIVTTFAALLLTAAVLVMYEIRSYEATALNDLTTQAELVGRASTAALEFDDPVTAGQNLDLLRVRPRISAAAIYRANGARFAAYRRAGTADTTLPAGAGPAGSRMSGDRLELFQTITDNDGRIGTVYLRAELGLAERLRTYLMIVGVALLGSLALALIMSSWLQASVTNPILAVSEVAHQVKTRRDLSLRAPKITEDEIGDLVDTFNDMITEVGQRTGALEQANRTLEREMAVRQEAEQALRAADQRKDEFLATLAHELRNPLAPLRNGLEILRAPGPDPALTRTTVEIMDRQLRQLVRLVDDLLDVSRITTGKLTLRKEDVALDAVVQSALDAAGALVDARGLRLSVQLPPQPVMVCVDATRISQVLLNLLHNATKFTEPGGAIVVTATADADTVTLTVADTGIGIPAAQLPLVFDMFAQLDQSLERTSSGLGVGLSLSRRLVELHGGTLQAASGGAGRGSTFTLRLPREAADRAVQEPEPAATGAFSRRRVLLVDDNADFVESFALLLERMGHEVRLAHDGEEALTAAREFGPDVAFLDIGLPKLNGYDLARRLRSETEKPVTLIAVTGWGQDSDKQRAREAGFDHHMTKPLDLDQVGRLLSVDGRPMPGAMPLGAGPDGR